MQSRDYNINLRGEYNPVTAVYLSQYDSGVELHFHVYDGTEPAGISGGAEISIMGRRPSGVGFDIPCTLVSNNLIIVSTTTDMTGEAGTFPVEIRFSRAGTDIGTVNFDFVIERAPHPDGTIDADITRQQTFVERLEALEENTVTDTTLSISGRPADAKETGDAIAELEEEISSIEVTGTLNSLTDVDLSSPTNGQALIYNSTTQKWENKNAAAPTDAQVESAVSDWLDDHPEATTTVQDGSITEAKLAADVKQMIEEAANSAQVKMSGILRAGQIFVKPDGLPYCGWPFNDVQYDASINSIVFLINAAVAHGQNASTHLYMGKMNLNTFDVTIAEIGDPATLGHGFYTMGFCINDDGDYMYIDAQSQMLGKSTDKGATWVETSVSAYNSWPESLKQLSNGRYLFWGDGSPKGVWYSDDDGATWTKATMTNPYFEGSFLELPDGVVMCFMRKSTNGTSNGAWNGTKIQEGICISVSEDYGATWTTAFESTTLLEGCANVATAFYHAEEDLIEVFTSPRYPYGDSMGAVWQYMAKRTDALDDKFGTPKLVAYAKAHSYQDFGHVGGCMDGNGDMHLMYYDGDSSTAGSVNYNYFKASRRQASLETVTENNSLYLPYSSYMVEQRIEAIRKNLQNQINELIIAGGGTPEDPDYYVTDGLVIGIDFTNRAKIDSANGKITDIFGNEFSGTFDENGVLTGDLTILGTTLRDKIQDLTAMTVEVNTIVTTASGNSNTPLLSYNNTWTDYVKARAITYRWTDSDGTNAVTKYAQDWDHAYGGAENLLMDVGKTQLTLVYGADGKILLYRNKTLIHTFTCEDYVSYAFNIAGNWLLRPDSKWTFDSLRVYNKALTAAEIEQNYNYLMS